VAAFIPCWIARAASQRSFTRSVEGFHESHIGRQPADELAGFSARVLTALGLHHLIRVVTAS